jgi:hypothetical protein
MFETDYDAIERISLSARNAARRWCAGEVCADAVPPGYSDDEAQIWYAKWHIEMQRLTRHEG